MKTKLLKHPMGSVKTQKEARNFVEKMREICDDLNNLAGIHPAPNEPNNKAMNLESSMKFFQTAMFVGMMALLDESKKTVNVEDFRYED